MRSLAANMRIAVKGETFARLAVQFPPVKRTAY
jgi:hypothetical protein